MVILTYKLITNNTLIQNKKSKKQIFLALNKREIKQWFLLTKPNGSYPNWRYLNRSFFFLTFRYSVCWSRVFATTWTTAGRTTRSSQRWSHRWPSSTPPPPWSTTTSTSASWFSTRKETTSFRFDFFASVIVLALRNANVIAGLLNGLSHNPRNLKSKKFVKLQKQLLPCPTMKSCI